MSERYQEVAYIGLRNAGSNGFVSVPLYIKLQDAPENHLLLEQEELMHRIASIIMRRYDRQIAEFIKTKKQGER